MEQRQSNPWRMSLNEKKFIEDALLHGYRVDGRDVYDYRQLALKFGREDGTVEVHLGQTHVMGCVTAQLVQPYRDRPNEGTLVVFTEFSPMADPSFEPGRPGEVAVELGRVIDRGLRESKAVDMESLAVIAGKYVWALRVDLHILDNCGNLIDAANVAALAALLTFRRPECTVTGEDVQDVIIHPAEERDPLPVAVHHLPIAVTFGIFNDGNTVIMDPSHLEEAVMGGRMTLTINSNKEICAIQKAGGEGLTQMMIMDCLRLASTKVDDITNKIRSEVEVYTTERALRKVKRHSKLVAFEVDVPETAAIEQNIDQLKLVKDEKSVKESTGSSQKAKTFVGSPAEWDPYSKGLTPEFHRHSVFSHGSAPVESKEVQPVAERKSVHPEKAAMEIDDTAVKIETSGTSIPLQTKKPKSLEDAIKPKSRRKKKGPLSTDERQ